MAMFQLSKLVSKITYRRTMLEKATGLMFRKELDDEAYVFPFEKDRKIPIHMLFVFHPIDVLWVNSENEIVDLKKSVRPWSPNIYHRGRAATLIEMPEGTIIRNQIKIMDCIVLA